MGDDRVVNLIKDYSHAGYFVVVYAHVGMLFTRFPNPIALDYLHSYADAGAGLVVTSHSHCLGGLEYYKGIPIFHSLGDFLMDGASFRRRQASFLKVEIDNHRVKSLEIVPVVTTDSLQVSPPQTRLADKMRASLSYVSRQMSKHQGISYKTFYKTQYKKEILQHSLSTIHFIYHEQGITGLIKTLLVRMEDVRRVAKWSMSDRSNVQSDTDALDVKKVLSEKDIYGDQYDC